MKILTIVLVLCFTLFTAEEKTFCDGFKKGFVKGYCAGDEFCIEPITPLCPIPHIGQDKYDDGYLRGVIAGKKKKCDE